MAISSSAKHDPGGKVRLKLLPGMTGRAWFSECGKYRHWLSRTFHPGPLSSWWLWIGMNPSTAEAEVDDPTIRKELKFTIRDGGRGYVKCNVMDYRATKPVDLRSPGVVPCSPENLKTILELAAKAERIVLGYGALHPSLQIHAYNTVTALRKAGHRLHCLDFTEAGHPKHPLYILDNEPLKKFENVVPNGYR